jgi:hypothetical protein
MDVRWRSGDYRTKAVRSTNATFFPRAGLNFLVAPRALLHAHCPIDSQGFA